jgi:hypothetical protein
MPARSAMRQVSVRSEAGLVAVGFVDDNQPSGPVTRHPIEGASGMAFGIPPSEGGPRLSYGSYLQVERLRSLQTPQSDPPQHDEMLFIIIHLLEERETPQYRVADGGRFVFRIGDQSVVWTTGRTDNHTWWNGPF